MSDSTVTKRIRSEIFSWTSLALVMALLEGGVIGVVVKNGFDGRVPDSILNWCVAIVTGAPYYANLISFVWVKFSHGKNKARLVSQLAVFVCLCALGISFVSFDTTGLIVLVVLLVISRLCWSGIMTIRANIWRVNYPRYIRGKVTAKLATLASLFMSLAAVFAGWLLDWQFSAFQALYMGFALLSLIGAYRYRFVSVRHQVKSLAREVAVNQSLSLTRILALLKSNKGFGRYMLAMFVLGSGNLMFMAPLILFLNDYTPMVKSQQILITTAIPLALVPIAVGWWARLLDGGHIFHFRARHSWGFVLAILTYVLAQTSGLYFLFYLGAFFYGVATAGAVIAWNLGHNDFVGDGNPMDYMAAHVTLTGVRGLFAPLLGVGFYQLLETYQPNAGRYALLLPLLITTIGGLLFVRFNYQRLAGKHD